MALKRNGWRNFTFRVKYEDGTEYNEPGRKNIFMRMMIDKVFSRPACYQCTCRHMERTSDITVADAWGAERFVPELIDDKGTSSIMINSEKGRYLLSLIQDECILEKVDVDKLWQKNKNIWKQYKMPEERNVFFKAIDKKGLNSSYNLLRLYRFWQVIKSRVKGSRE